MSDFKMDRCPVCGKEFWIPSRPRWAYREKRSGVLMYFCSRTCMKKENKKDG